ncbi:unnamed protein product (macronuclear) [Paramecium tetraurelia]|uniref:JmjC domain-containing protein n=1 Tax=Paramecium tetraurelia TaxID=5888 RepID=A0BW15_PARTE|nr:uncharacterized protein GSPATT00032584001 [Paramecium tetraurelia]CAK62732.1 unnamed protein product [Paramecium tetraurelia]|eukprot:XP_001430130.1 hypothetical protein (macronuclear) [Paramecium tetraurelia strain d4-2]
MYIEYVQNNFNPSASELELLKSQEIKELYEYIQQQGGFIKYYSQQYNEFQSYDNNEILQLFQKYLLNYELRTTDVDGQYLHRCAYIELNKAINCFTEPPQMWLQDQVTLWSLPNYVSAELNKNLFTFQDLSKNHKNFEIDIIAQNPFTDTTLAEEENYYQTFRMTLSQYKEYAEDPKLFFQNNPQYKSDKVYQAVNVDMEDWKEEIHRLFDFLPTCFTRNNGLNYLRQNCKGANVPEIYMRVQNCWIGGQQDFQGLSQVNINHGPGDCVWTIIDANYIDKLFSITPDLFRKEGRWYVNIEFFLKNQIPVRQVIQKKGDILIIGAGCFFQAKNIGNSIHTSFNFLMVDEFSIQQIYKRQNRNDFFRFQDVIAIRNLFLDIYIHEKLSILQNYLKYFIDQEFRRQLSKNKLTNFELFISSKDVLICTKCNKEIFIFFQFIKDWVYYCPDCYVDYEKVIYMKYSIIQLKYLIQADNIQCSKLLCSNYVGESNCALKQIIQEQVQLSEEEDNSSIFESRKFLDEFIVGLNMESLNSHLQNGVSQQQDVLSNDTRQVQKITKKIKTIKLQQVKKKKHKKSAKYSELQVIKYIQQTKRSILN